VKYVAQCSDGYEKFVLVRDSVEELGINMLSGSFHEGLLEVEVDAAIPQGLADSLELTAS
jgi:hypothetical protein